MSGLQLFLEFHAYSLISIHIKWKDTIVSISNPTVNKWCDHTINPNIPIDNIAYIIPIEPNIVFLANVVIIWLIIPNPGNINM